MIKKKKGRRDYLREHQELVDKSVALWKEHKLKECSYYVAEVSWSAQNPPHNVIIATDYKPEYNVLIFSRNYENLNKVMIGALHSFKIIAKIPAMNK